jgi:pyruvate dehydrogenase E2 component (dihydrolipoamide acetyltransferase)
LARSLGVDLTTLTPGSGTGGIVTRADVEQAASPTSAPGGLPTPPTGYAVVPVRGVRAVIADRMSLSHATIPVATCGLTVDATELLATRSKINAALERRGGAPVVTPFSLLCFLLARALHTHPALNASFVADASSPRTRGRSDEIRVFDDLHLGFATATPRGLLVPVVRRAQTLGLVELSREMARLASAGRDGALAPTELQGSTFTVSNFGALGLDDGIPIINPPEAAILGVGSIRRRPHVVDDEVVARSTAALTLCFDHRVGDGAEAGALMGLLRELIEAPVLALASPCGTDGRAPTVGPGPSAPR